MGSIDPMPEEVTVLVTGFGPFKEQYPKNPSWEIASSLPDYLPSERVKDPNAAGPGRGGGGGGHPVPPRVRIVTPKKAIRVNYDVVREMVPTLWDNDDDASTSAEAPATTEAATPRSDEQQQQQSTTDKTTTPHPPTNGKDEKNKYDFVLHIGMAGPQPVYQIERRGHRDGYRLRDVDGNLLGDEERHRAEGDRWIWHGVPHELLTDLDIEGVYRRWVARSPKRENTVLRISEDPGRYLCDFIYFSSLAHLWKQGKPRDVLFLHVPAVADDATLAYGRELVLQLIRAIVEVHLTGHQQQQQQQ
ncbi:pyroglutamyl-peptidase [Microdochium nivale]|nr:pyroglutamyl-peptidase [Microdochium nivale]